MTRRTVHALLGSLTLLAIGACSSPSGDPAAIANVTPLGHGLRIAQVSNPSAADHSKYLPPTPASTAYPTVHITGASFLTVDTFDETQDGKSRGSVYVQDVGSSAPYSGLSIFTPTWIPADLRVSPGDVLDFSGPYEELAKIGTAIFPAGQILPQLAKPVGTFRYEYSVPTPTVIDASDLNTYAKGRQWLNMLVTAHDVTIDVFQNDMKGRITAKSSMDTTVNGWAISNELIPIAAGDSATGMGDYPARSTFKSVTGIVTWFYSFHIAPRSKDDLVQ